jgi:predicted MPP superfamily phosphohydrolase
MHRYDNNFIVRLINILFDVDERNKERDESLPNASNKLNTRTYVVMCLDNEWIRGEVKKKECTV